MAHMRPGQGLNAGDMNYHIRNFAVRQSACSLSKCIMLKANRFRDRSTFCGDIDAYTRIAMPIAYAASIHHELCISVGVMYSLGFESTDHTHCSASKVLESCTLSHTVVSAILPHLQILTGFYRTVCILQGNVAELTSWRRRRYMVRRTETRYHVFHTCRGFHGARWTLVQ